MVLRAFDSTGERMCSLSRDGTLSFWDCGSGVVLAEHSSATLVNRHINCMHIETTISGPVCVLGTSDGELLIWSSWCDTLEVYRPSDKSFGSVMALCSLRNSSGASTIAHAMNKEGVRIYALIEDGRVVQFQLVNSSKNSTGELSARLLVVSDSLFNTIETANTSAADRKTYCLECSAYVSGSTGTNSCIINSYVCAVVSTRVVILDSESLKPVCGTAEPLKLSCSSSITQIALHGALLFAAAEREPYISAYFIGNNIRGILDRTSSQSIILVGRLLWNEPVCRLSASEIPLPLLYTAIEKRCAETSSNNCNSADNKQTTAKNAKKNMKKKKKSISSRNNNNATDSDAEDGGDDTANTANAVSTNNSDYLPLAEGFHMKNNISCWVCVASEKAAGMFRLAPDLIQQYSVDCVTYFQLFSRWRKPLEVFSLSPTMKILTPGMQSGHERTGPENSLNIIVDAKIPGSIDIIEELRKANTLTSGNNGSNVSNAVIFKRFMETNISQPIVLVRGSDIRPTFESIRTFTLENYKEKTNNDDKRYVQAKKVQCLVFKLGNIKADTFTDLGITNNIRSATLSKENVQTIVDKLLPTVTIDPIHTVQGVGSNYTTQATESDLKDIEARANGEASADENMGTMEEGSDADIENNTIGTSLTQAQLLTQGLISQDDPLVTEIIANTEGNTLVIQKTIKGINGSIAIAFLNFVSRILDANDTEVTSSTLILALLPWIKGILTTHKVSIMSSKSASVCMQKLRKLLRLRIQNYSKICDLVARVGMATTQFAVGRLGTEPIQVIDAFGGIYGKEDVDINELMEHEGTEEYEEDSSDDDEEHQDGNQENNIKIVL